MRISARADYAVRAMLELAALPTGATCSARELAAVQGIPQNFLENILTTLRQAGLVRTQRGPSGGSMLGRSADAITVADVLRAVEGPLTAVRDLRPEELAYAGAARALPELWCAVGRRLDEVLGAVTLCELATPAGDRAAR